MKFLLNLCFYLTVVSIAACSNPPLESNKTQASEIIKTHTIYDELLKVGLVKKELPLTHPESLRANNANPYSVQSVDGKLVVKKTIEKRPDIDTYKSDKFSFVGTNRGEWGGGLELKNNETGKSSMLINDNIVKIEYYNDVLYVFAGLSHLNIDRGTIYMVSSLNNTPIVDRKMALNSAPLAISRTESGSGKTVEFYIATFNGLAEFFPGRQISKPLFDGLADVMRPLLDKQFWHSLYPTSIVKIDDKIVIGIRAGVAVVSLDAFDKVSAVEFFTDLES